MEIQVQVAVGLGFDPEQEHAAVDNIVDVPTNDMKLPPPFGKLAVRTGFDALADDFEVFIANVDFRREIVRARRVVFRFFVSQPTVVVDEAPLGRQAFVVDVRVFFGLVFGGKHDVSHQQRVVSPKLEVTAGLGVERPVDRVDEVVDDIFASGEHHRNRGGGAKEGKTANGGHKIARLLRGQYTRPSFDIGVVSC